MASVKESPHLVATDTLLQTELWYTKSLQSPDTSDANGQNNIAPPSPRTTPELKDFPYEEDNSDDPVYSSYYAMKSLPDIAMPEDKM